jgi:hypothetical protein
VQELKPITLALAAGALPASGAAMAQSVTDALDAQVGPVCGAFPPIAPRDTVTPTITAN